MKTETQTVIGWRFWNGRTHFAQNLPGDGGKDWGYTYDSRQALPLTPYWARRFAADARRCGDTAHFL